MRRHALLWLAAFLSWVPVTGAADLGHIGRTIRKEPAYRDKPTYCLAVFGPQARTRVWLVRDGLTLYVDRNGDGDLTEPGKRVEISQHKHGYLLRGDAIAGRQRGDHAKRIEYDEGVFYCGDVVDAGGSRFTNLVVFLEKTRAIDVGVKTPAGLMQGAGADSQGDLHFSDSPHDAPVIHFGGTLTLTMFTRSGQLFPQFPDGRKHLYGAQVGTPGVGPGTFVSVQITSIPDDVWPEARIEFPHRPGETPLQAQHVDLLTRC